MRWSLSIITFTGALNQDLTLNRFLPTSKNQCLVCDCDCVCVFRGSLTWSWSVSRPSQCSYLINVKLVSRRRVRVGWRPFTWISLVITMTSVVLSMYRQAQRSQLAIDRNTLEPVAALTNTIPTFTKHLCSTYLTRVTLQRLRAKLRIPELTTFNLSFLELWRWH